MSGPESMKPDDQLLDEFLAGEGAVRAVYRQRANERAPAHLDAAILQAAQAVSRPLPRRVRSRWQAPLATAAVLVLGIGVLLQVQRDPAAQRAVTALPPAAPAAVMVQEKKEVAAKADQVAEAEAAPAEIADAKPAPAPAPAKPALQAEKRRAAPAAEMLPPPPPRPAPALAMDAAPAPAPFSAMPMASEPEAAAAGAVAAESQSRQERTAAAPMAKAMRAPAAANLMSAPDTAVSAGGGADMAAIEEWARDCGVPSPDAKTPAQWRGLPVARWTATTLQFAPTVTQEAIVASLGALAGTATLATADCSTPVTRALRREGKGWALVCECGD